MSNADASERQRLAARARWDPSPVVTRAAQTLIERSDELSAELRAQVAHAVTGAAPGGDGGGEN